MSTYIDAGALIRHISDWQFGESPSERMTEEEYLKAQVIYETLDNVIKQIERECALAEWQKNTEQCGTDMRGDTDADSD